MALKDDILSSLEENRGAFVSGQALAEKFGVSRAAVSKAVAALREDGRPIESATNRGYRLSADDLSEAGIRAALPDRYRDIGIVVLRETDSTNNEAKRLLSAGKNGTFLVSAGSQTGGRGRRGRSFASPPGSGAYLTLAVRADASITDAVSSTTRAATATALALEKLTGDAMQIKWVNDVYYKGKKLCGILTEAVSDFESGVTQTLIIGIGVNMHSDGLPEDLRDIAGALDKEGLTRCAVIGAVAAEVLDLVAELTDRAYLDAYRARSLVLGHEVTFSGGGFDSQSGLAEDIDDEVLKADRAKIRKEAHELYDMQKNLLNYMYEQLKGQIDPSDKQWAACASMCAAVTKSLADLNKMTKEFREENDRYIEKKIQSGELDVTEQEFDFSPEQANKIIAHWTKENEADIQEKVRKEVEERDLARIGVETKRIRKNNENRNCRRLALRIYDCKGADYQRSYEGSTRDCRGDDIRLRVTWHRYRRVHWRHFRQP